MEEPEGAACWTGAAGAAGAWASALPDRTSAQPSSAAATNDGETRDGDGRAVMNNVPCADAAGLRRENLGVLIIP